MTAVRMEQIGDAALYLGDCREILPTLRAADTLITDPVWPNCPADLLTGASDPFGLFLDMWEAIEWPKRAVIVMRHDSDPRFLAAIPDKMAFFRTQILPYVMPGYIGRKLGGDELAYCFGEPLPSRPGGRVIPGYAPKVQPDGRAANGHPCSRALGHFRWLIDWWSLSGETVIDPFMGSGTTGVAAVEKGRRFIGIEIEPRYFDLARRRIEAAQQQETMFAQAGWIQEGFL